MSRRVVVAAGLRQGVVRCAGYGRGGLGQQGFEELRGCVHPEPGSVGGEHYAFRIGRQGVQLIPR